MADWVVSVFFYLRVAFHIAPDQNTRHLAWLAHGLEKWLMCCLHKPEAQAKDCLHKPEAQAKGVRLLRLRLRLVCDGAQGRLNSQRLVARFVRLKKNRRGLDSRKNSPGV